MPLMSFDNMCSPVDRLITNVFLAFHFKANISDLRRLPLSEDETSFKSSQMYRERYLFNDVYEETRLQEYPRDNIES